MSFNQTVVLWENLEQIKKKQQQNFEIIVCKDRHNAVLYELEGASSVSLIKCRFHANEERFLSDVHVQWCLTAVCAEHDERPSTLGGD